MPVVTVVVLLHCESDRITEVAESVAEIEEVYEVYSVSGDADIIAIVRFKEFEQIAEIISSRIAKIPGVIRTSTHVAFRQYSSRTLAEGYAFD